MPHAHTSYTHFTRAPDTHTYTHTYTHTHTTYTCLIPHTQVVAAYAKYALEYCALILGRVCTDVVDVGAGRCYFSEGMRRRGTEVLSVEGTVSGFEVCVVRAGANSVVRRDLRLPLDLPNGRRFALGNVLI